jgi:DNA-binding winged helix-turn-helix (wHTH) protein
MSLHSGHLYEFGPFRLEPAERRLLRDGQHVPLPPKAFDVLVVLVSRADHLVSKEDLLKEVWPDTFVEEASLSYTVSVLRKALQAGAEQTRYIDTVQTLGYRFTCPVRTLTATGLRADIEVLPPASPVTEQKASTTPTLPAVERSRPWHGTSSRKYATIAIGVLGLIVAAVLFLRYAREVPPAPGQAWFDETVPGHIILTDLDQPVMSPDGRRVALTGVSEGRRQL